LRQSGNRLDPNIGFRRKEKGKNERREVRALEAAECANGLSRVRPVKSLDERSRIIAGILDGKQMVIERPLKEEEQRQNHGGDDSTVAPPRHPD
jgi:hypothetical protein